VLSFIFSPLQVFAKIPLDDGPIGFVEIVGVPDLTGSRCRASFHLLLNIEEDLDRSQISLGGLVDQLSDDRLAFAASCETSTASGLCHQPLAEVAWVLFHLAFILRNTAQVYPERSAVDLE